jgi:6-phosphogluconate dehydrogenase
VWRGGCIIRSALLPPLQEALERKSGPPHPLLSSPLAGTVASHLEDLRSVARTGIARGIPLPALTAALAHVEGLRTARLPANLIQAQRDYFGSHGFARLDQTGTFHGPWRDA